MPGAHLDDATAYDAILIFGFGGPEGPDDVLPYLRTVTAGRGIPDERLAEVGEHYALFGGVSPINWQTAAFVKELERLLAAEGPDLPVYWGNRNTAPWLRDAIKQMHADGVTRAAVWPTSAYSSYSGCRQYREDLAAAVTEAGLDGQIELDKLRTFFNHPAFIDANADQLRVARAAIPDDRVADARIAFTAHSIPSSWAEVSPYETQLRETCRLVTEMVGVDAANWDLVWQSRSGPPQVPWLEPDIVDHLEKLATDNVRDVIVMPIGFVSDHIEVRFDLDVEAQQKAAELGMHMVRAGTVSADPRIIRMIRDLVVERMTDAPKRPALGDKPAGWDRCAANCCPNIRRPETPAMSQLPADADAPVRMD